MSYMVFADGLRAFLFAIAFNLFAKREFWRKQTLGWIGCGPGVLARGKMLVWCVISDLEIGIFGDWVCCLMLGIPCKLSLRARRLLCIKKLF